MANNGGLAFGGCGKINWAKTQIFWEALSGSLNTCFTNLFRTEYVGKNLFSGGQAIRLRGKGFKFKGWALHRFRTHYFTQEALASIIGH